MLTASMKPRVPSSMDRDLESRVTNFLLGHKMPSMRQIRVEAQDGNVTLRGVVGSFYQKQLCLSCCRHVAGVRHLIDEVEVASGNLPALAGAG